MIFHTFRWRWNRILEQKKRHLSRRWRRLRDKRLRTIFLVPLLFVWRERKETGVLRMWVYMSLSFSAVPFLLCPIEGERATREEQFWTVTSYLCWRWMMTFLLDWQKIILSNNIVFVVCHQKATYAIYLISHSIFIGNNIKPQCT
jgi:hypothetical protein